MDYLALNKKEVQVRVLLVSTHNVCFLGEMRKILTFVMLNKLFIKMPSPFLIVSQSDYLIQVVDINSHT